MNIEVKDTEKSNVIINAEIINSPFAMYSDGDIAFLDNLKGMSPDRMVSVKADMFILIMCRSGSAQFEVNSVRYTIGPRQAFICMPKLVMNACVFSPDFEAATLCLSTRIMAKFIGESKLWEKAFEISRNPIIEFNEENAHIFSLFGELITHRLNATNRPYKKEVMSSITAAAVFELFAEIEKQHGKETHPVLTSGDRLFQRFIILLNDQEVKQRSVSWYADKLCVTTKYLSSVCKSISKRTARSIISMYVVADIQHLLKYSTLSTKEIAAKLDFPNISFFGKYVKAHLGMSPNEYRRRARRGDA